ncbi:hypothetical protein [Novosphingobium sp. PhB55]|uniref:hypothetical protein n=1 Tax=Novosphingobium sp. PhB55 TaxID=2485106 RepID=UPI001065B266|nr:hypothetical protein [Novosphingobium sp. PhB55]
MRKQVSAVDGQVASGYFRPEIRHLAERTKGQKCPKRCPFPPVDEGYGGFPLLGAGIEQLSGRKGRMTDRQLSNLRGTGFGANRHFGARTGMAWVGREQPEPDGLHPGSENRSLNGDKGSASAGSTAPPPSLQYNAAFWELPAIPEHKPQ